MSHTGPTGLFDVLSGGHSLGDVDLVERADEPGLMATDTRMTALDTYSTGTLSADITADSRSLGPAIEDVSGDVARAVGELLPGAGLVKWVLAAFALLVVLYLVRPLLEIVANLTD